MLPFIVVLPLSLFGRSAAQGSSNSSSSRDMAGFDGGSFPDTSGDYFRNTHVAYVHSHNDYWRDVPLLTALSYGCASVEADVWLVNQTLYIGHDVASLRPSRTFQSLYIDPLVRILDQKNPTNAFTAYARNTYGYTELNGVYDTDSGVSLYLLIDVKTDGPTTWPYVVAALEPLRQKGYLTYVNASDISAHNGPVTIIGTGNTPLPYLLARPSRDYFFDAPLSALNSTFVPTLSPLASTSFKVSIGWDGKFNATSKQIGNITKLIDAAHAQGLKARLWDNPTWPIYARDRVWRTVSDAGADYINADDLAAATAM